MEEKGFVQIDKSRFRNGKPSDAVSLKWEKLLINTCKYIMHNWWNENQNYENEGEYLDFGYLENNFKTGDYGPETLGGIRTPSEYAYVIAVSIFTKTYSSVETGISEAVAIDRAVTIVKSLAKDHLINGGINQPWGEQWQSAQWASKTAVAAWLLWDYLNEIDRENVVNMIEYEAHRFNNSKPPAANEDYRNDTKAEENGWNASGIQAACGILPKNTNYKRWLEKSIEYRATALAIPSDTINTNLLDDRPVFKIVTGYNMDSTGALGNHNAYPHPDYMASPLRHTIEGALYLTLGKVKVPEANRFNCNLIYQNFVNHKWNDESSIYYEDGSVYWPIKIEEDRKFEFITFGIIDAGGSFLEYDKLARIKADKWEELHTDKALEYELTGFITASAYLLHWLDHQEISFYQD